MAGRLVRANVRLQGDGHRNSPQGYDYLGLARELIRSWLVSDGPGKTGTGGKMLSAAIPRDDAGLSGCFGGRRPRPESRSVTVRTRIFDAAVALGGLAAGFGVGASSNTSSRRSRARRDGTPAGQGSSYGSIE